MKKRNSGITLIGLLVVCIIVALLFLLLILASQGVKKRSLEIKCLENLDQINKATKVYLLDFGRNVLYPPWKNPEFFTTLYKTQVIADTKFFRCPASGNKPASEEKIYNNDPDVTDYLCRTTTTRIVPRSEIRAGIWEKQFYHSNKRAVLTAIGGCPGVGLNNTGLLTEPEFTEMRQREQGDILWQQLRIGKLTIAEIENYANHPRTRMRTLIAYSNCTPIKTLERLSQDDDHSVRLAIAENPNTPLSILKVLAKDSAFSVKHAALKRINRKTTK